MRRIAGWFLLALGIGVTPLFAQTASNANIRGRLTDESGATLPGVSVTATSPALIGGQLTAVSDTEGAVSFCRTADWRLHGRLRARRLSAPRA